MPHKPPKLVTTGVIAHELGTTTDRVRRVLERHPEIKPRAYAGITRLFDNEAIARIRYLLNRTDAIRSGRKGGRHS